MNSKEEADFLHDLLAGIDPDDIVNAVPTPVTTPAKKRQREFKPKSPEKENFSAAELEGLGWDWDIEEDEFMTPKKRKSPGKIRPLSPSKKTIPPVKEPAPWTPDPYTRCTVEFIEEINHRETHLRVSKSSDPSQIYTVKLYDDWTHTPIQIGDTLNIIGPPSPTTPHTIEITTKSNLLIHHPDILITSTALSNAPSCTRKSLLSSMLKSTTAGGDGTTPSLVWGNMVHEIVQEFLEYRVGVLRGKVVREGGKTDGEWLEERVERVVMGGLLHLFKISVEVEQAKREIRMRIRGLVEWMDKYISTTPNSEATLSDTRATASSNSVVAITALHAIEEDIWSPKYGLKGMLDATISVTIQDHIPPPTPAPNNKALNNNNKPTNPSRPTNPKLTSFFPRASNNPQTQAGGEQHRVAPLEIKTGRSIGGMEHRAQTMLYTLLAEERYNQPVEGGLLYYTQGKQNLAGPPPPHPYSSGAWDSRSQSNASEKPPGSGSGMGEGENGENEQIVLRVPRNRNEVKALVQKRNEMAWWMMKRARQNQSQNQNASHAHNDAMDGEVLQEEEEEEEEDGRILPECIDDERTCSRCYAVDACMLFRKTIEHPDPITSPPLSGKLQEIYTTKTSHLTPARCAFFKKWEKLISMEEQDQMRFKKEIWTVRAEERERSGRCFAGMCLVGGGLMSEVEGLEEGGLSGSVSGGFKFHKYRFVFRRHTPSSASSPRSSQPINVLEDEQDSAEDDDGDDGDDSSTSLLNGHITVGDAVTVSIEPDLVAFTRGFVVRLTPREVVLGVEMDIGEESVRGRWGHRLAPPHPPNEKVLDDKGLGEKGLGEKGLGERGLKERGLVYRIDKDEMSIGMTRVRDNLAQVFYAHGDSRRLELVVDLKAPEFWKEGEVPLPHPHPHPNASVGPDLNSNTGAPSTSHLSPPHTSHLNPSQEAAVSKVLCAKDYALILGMPGTGKTTVIAEIVRRLVGMGKTVLLTSYTHSAVDNILKKISPVGVGDDPRYVREDLVLRIGNEDKVHPDAKRFTLGARPRARTLEMLERQLMMPSVVATTCLTIDHALFSRRQFNYCIVDEASQITLPTCLGPLRFADKFILVGDHFQLPPLVRNRQARKGGLETSLFRMLSEAHPHAVVDLTEQYRMNEDIMCLSNRLIYGDRLRCGDEKTKNHTLVIPDQGEFLRDIHRAGGAHGEVCWLQRILDERCKVVFIDTDGLPAPDSRIGDLVHNPVEAELVRQLTETLLASGVPQDQIGVISLYRQQIKLISAMLDGRKDVEIMTADRSQGRDKEVVFISMVRSNNEGKIGELVKDWRRINVSFTRAKSKLVIFGSRSTLRSTALLNDFFDLVEDKDWVYVLKPGDHLLHQRAIPWTSSHTKKSLGVDPESFSPSQSSVSVSSQMTVEGTEPPQGSQRFRCTKPIYNSSQFSRSQSQLKHKSSTPVLTPASTPPSTKRSRSTVTTSPEDDADDSSEIEIVEVADDRPAKKIKSDLSARKSGRMGEEALTRGRPLLSDLMNDDR